jgi:DNA mismatch repair protein MutS
MIINEYIELQNKYVKKFGPKTILLMEVGSFFEYYGIETPTEKWGPIRKVAAILDAHVTRKNKKKEGTGKDNPLMAGFPNHSINKHVDKLLAASYTVVIVTQDSHGSANPEREVSAIYSPGTNLEFNKTYDSNYLACIYIEPFTFLQARTQTGLSIGFSIVDVSTGENKLYETSSKVDDIMYSLDEIYRMIQFYKPQEVLLYVPKDVVIPDESKHPTDNSIGMDQDALIRIFELKKSTYYFCSHNTKDSKKVYQAEVLNRAFTNSTKLSIFEYLNLEHYDVSLKSYICLLQFAYEHNEMIIQKLLYPVVITDKERLILTYNSIHQLDIVPNKNNDTKAKFDSLLSIINKCRTCMGKRMLRTRICNPITNMDKLCLYYDQIDFFRTKYPNDNSHDFSGKPHYEQVEPMLMNIIDLERAHRKMTLGYLSPGEFIGVDSSYRKILDLITLFQTNFADHNFEIGLPGFTKEVVEQFQTFSAEYNSTINFDIISQYYKDKITENIFQKGVYPEIDLIQDKIDYY